jgi:hypothetical protein
MKKQVQEETWYTVWENNTGYLLIENLMLC